MPFNKHPKRDRARQIITLKEIRRRVPIFMSYAWRTVSGANLEREARRFRNGKNQRSSRLLSILSSRKKVTR